jgi:hypothetical protein
LFYESCGVAGEIGLSVSAPSVQVIIVKRESEAAGMSSMSNHQAIMNDYANVRLFLDPVAADAKDPFPLEREKQL